MNNLEAQLWKIANDLRGSMDSSEFKNYMLGFIFFKYLSENIENVANKELELEDIKEFKNVHNDIELENELKELMTEKIGYYLEYKYMFSQFINRIKKDEDILMDLDAAFKYIENSTVGTDSEDDFQGLFDDLDLTNNKLGATTSAKNALISSIMINIDAIEGLTDNVDILGNAYEYLIKMFASDAGKKGGEFYTPKEVSTVVAKLATVNVVKARSLYDPTCGSGSLLLNAYHELNGDITKVYGQELNVTTYNLARMNMFLHGVKFNKFSIQRGNTLTEDKFEKYEGETGFELIVANPPFGVNWDANPVMLSSDPRFVKYGKLAPKSKGEFAFLQHMLYHLHENGTMVSVVPHGVLFRGAAELHIRKYMIEMENVIDAVIGLPANLFYGTSIPACIIVFKKCRENDDILFIDASKEFDKVKTQNVLSEEHINKIVETYKSRSDIDKYSRKVAISEIEENEYNLNIPRYVDTFEEEEPIDIDEVNREIARLKQAAIEKEKEIEILLAEVKALGLLDD